MCKKRAWVRDTLFRRDNSATVCSHSFQPLNQSVRIPTWSRNIMACLLGEENRNVRMGRGRGLLGRFLSHKQSQSSPAKRGRSCNSPGIPSDWTEGPSHGSGAGVTADRRDVSIIWRSYGVRVGNVSTVVGNDTNRKRVFFSNWFVQDPIIRILTNQ